MTTAPDRDAWSWSDAWILASLSGRRSGMTLSELIGSADAHNHAIPTREELANALGSLIAASLVEPTDRGFKTTKQGESIKKHWRGNMFAWSEPLLKRLNGVAKVVREHPLTEEEVDQAYAEYMRRV